MGAQLRDELHEAGQESDRREGGEDPPAWGEQQGVQEDPGRQRIHKCFSRWVEHSPPAQSVIMSADRNTFFVLVFSSIVLGLTLGKT